MSAINAIKQINNLHPLIFKIKQLIKNLQNYTTIQFSWIKGHSDIF